MKLKEAYVAMEGQYDDVYRRIPNDESIVRFLKKFKDSSDFSTMLEAFDKKDYRGVFEASHNLKGMCGNLSLSKLTMSCTAVCESVRHGDPSEDITPLVNKAKADYDKVIKVIENLD